MKQLEYILSHCILPVIAGIKIAEWIIWFLK